MIVDVFPQLYQAVSTAILALYSGAAVSDVYSSTATVFPYVTVREAMNNARDHTLNYLEQTSLFGIQVDIYMTGGAKRATAMAIATAVDGVLYGTWKLKRVDARPVENMQDVTIYRYTMRFEGLYNSLTNSFLS